MASDPIDAELIRSLLSTFEVQAIVKGEHLFVLPGIPMMSDGAPSVWVVDDEEEAKARELIERHRRAPASTAPAWSCRICTEDNEGGFSNCWKCGATGPLPSEQESET
jgi:hypothetical protein